MNLDHYALREYQRLRAMGWHAKQALDATRTRSEWEKYECGEFDTPALGYVRLRVEPEMYPEMGNLTDAAEGSHEYARLLEIAERDGVWGLIGEYFDGDKWQHADSCWGFIGGDWKDSGYDADIMRATLAAAKECANSQLLQGAV